MAGFLESFSRRPRRVFTPGIILLALITAVGTLAAQTPAAQAKANEPEKTRTARKAPALLPPPATKTPGLPFNRVIRPGLLRSLAKAAPTAKTHRFANAATSQGSATSNFGGFQAATEYVAYDTVDQDLSPLAVFASGDFNHDGKPDLVTLQASGTVNVILNKGGGSFGSPISAPGSPNVSSPVQAIGVDVNKDGNDDLVLVDTGNNTVDVLLSKGDGTFGAAQTFTASSSNYIASAAVGDVNGDGFPDLVTVSSNLIFNPDNTLSTTIEVDTMLNDGKGGFLSPTASQQVIYTLQDEYDTLWGRSIALADVNGDGIPDVTLQTRHWLANPTLTEDSEHIITTFLGVGGGIFSPPNSANNIAVPSQATVNFGATPLVANLNVVDINHDGFKDIVFSYQDYSIWAALGNGDGTYQRYYNVGAYLAYPTDLMVSDIDGDGFPVLIDAELGYVGIYPNNGNSTFNTQSIPYYGSGVGQFSVLSIADFNGDGTPDTAVMNSLDGTVTILAGVPTTPPTFHAGALINPQMGNLSGVEAQTVLDVNGDGNDDIVLYNYQPTLNFPGLVTAIGDGKGNFVYKNAVPSYQPTVDDFIDQVKGDFNGDGLDDLVLHTETGVSVLLSNGDGSFTLDPLNLPSFSCITGKSAVGDVNGDGKQDLIIAYGGDKALPGCNSGTTPSGLFVLLGKGDGTFQSPNYIALGDEVYEPVLLDTNGDGKLDLIVSDVPFDLLAQGISGTFNTFLLLGNGDGTFQTPTTLVANNINAHTMTGDLNGDGKIDLAILTEGNVDDEGNIDLSTAGVMPLLAKGDGTYTPQPLFLPGFFSSGGQLIDINGDGKPDLTLSEFISYDFTDPIAGGVAALGNGDGTFTVSSSYEGGDESSLILEGDFVKDGAPDMLYVSGGVSGTSLLLNLGGTTVALTADQTSVEQGQPVSVMATVKATMATRPQPTGTITLMEGSTNLGTGTLSGGSATISVSGLAVGTHTITAVYSGDSNFNVNSTASISEVVTAPPPAPAVTVNASASTLSLKRGQTGTITFTALANATFSGNVSFTVSGGSTGMSISITPSQVALTPGQSGTSVLVVSTTSPSSALQPPFTLGGGLSLAALFLLAIPRRLTRKLSSYAVAILGIVALAGVLGLTGCGGGGGIKTAPEGSSTLTITATPAGLTAQMVSVTVTVQ